MFLQPDKNNRQSSYYYIFCQTSIYIQLDQSVHRLHEILIGAGVPHYLRKYSRDIATIAASGAAFITPDRADNDLASASEKDAVQILYSALSRLAGG